MRLFSVIRPAALSSALCLSLICGTAVTAMAMDDSEMEMSNIVVSATKTERDLMDVPASVSVVSEKDIRRRAYTSIADMLQDVPGVEVFDESLAGAKRLNIRGESGSRVLILIDGQKINEQKSMDGAPLLIDPNQIDRIEVVKGPASVLYGSEAIGGVVNVITKKGGDKPIQASASLTYDGSTEGFNGNVAVYGAIDAFQYRVSGTRSDQGDRETPDGTLEESDSEMTSYNGFLGYHTDTMSLGIGVEDYDSEVESPPTEVMGRPFDLNLPEWSRQKVNLFADFKGVSELFPRLRFDTYFQETKKDFWQAMGLMTGEMRMQTYNEQGTSGASFQADILPHESHYLIAGYSFTQDTLDADTTFEMYVGGSPMGRPFSYFHEAAITTHALYLQDEWMLPMDTTLTIGGRQTWVESELEDTDDPKAIKGSVDDSQAVFSAGLTWTGAENLTLRGLVSQGYRFPDLNKLFIGTPHGGEGFTLGNPDLDPETSNNIEFGTRFNDGAWNIDITAFFNDAEDYITTQTVGPGVSQFANVDKAETKGIEAYLAYSFPVVNLTPYVSGVWMKRKYDTGTFSTWKTNTPEYLGRVGIKYERELSAFPGTVWTDLWMRAAADANDIAPNGTVTTTDSWETVNMAIGGEFGEKRQYQFSLNLNNLSDESYTTAQNRLEEAGFHAVVHVGVRF
ncbi:MAG: hypothetical protein CSA22_03015 [Deltaproteobacteria bacterium]|nr:MAG: hypothetical protein CSA22_03015 [Deltaproteobacteria bacterium]